MNIKQAEELSGVSRQNIRFYEREGLLSPDRNPENDYREYREDHIRRLKQIRAMRMLDMPLEKIRLVLAGKLTLSQAAAEQETRLIRQKEQLQTAIRLCGEWKSVSSLEAMDVDAMLQRMEEPENAEGLCRKWLMDYRKVVLSERQKVFTFVPDEAVTTPAEFTAALFAHANENGLNLVVTRESMYPEFTIDGIEYTAERFYTAVQRVPTATIRCCVKYPEDFEPDVSEKRKKYMKLLNLSWLVIPFILMNLDWIIHTNWKEFLSTWEGWVAFVGILALIFTGFYRTWLYHFNEKQ